MDRIIRNCVFAFKCEQRWDDMSPTKVHDVKFCFTCQREVFFCQTDKQLREAINLNRCIAIEFVEPETQKYYQLTGSPVRAKTDGMEDDVFF